MKIADIEKIHQAGLINNDQKENIIRHFQLNQEDKKEEHSKFLTIVSLLGGFLVICGLILLIAANWNQLSDTFKLSCGLSLMVGCHLGGYFLRDYKEIFPKLGEAFYLIGSGLFLGNIALIGQVYNLSSRLPNAIFIWAVGIAPLAWILRSKVHHILSLLAFAAWFCGETFADDGFIRWKFGADTIYLFLFVTTLGLLYLALSIFLRRTRFSEFGRGTQKIALLLINGSLYPFAWSYFYDFHRAGLNMTMLFLFTLAGLALNFGALMLEKELDVKGKILFAAMILITGLAIVAIPRYGVSIRENHWSLESNMSPSYLLSAGLLFTIAFLQTKIGILLKSAFMLNFAVVTIGLILLAAYICLFKNMANTGLMFLSAGIFMLLMAVFLEKQRRSMMKKMEAPKSGASL